MFYFSCRFAPQIVNGGKQWPAAATNLQLTRGDRVNWMSIFSSHITYSSHRLITFARSKRSLSRTKLLIVLSKLIVATDFARNTVNSDRANKGAVTLKVGICFQQTNRSELLSAHSSRLSGNKSLCQRLPPRRRIRSNA